MPKAVGGNVSDRDGNSIAGGASCPALFAAPLSRAGVALAPPLLVLPCHTFVFAEPLSSTQGAIITSEDEHLTVGKEAVTGAADISCPENNNGSPAVLVGEVRKRRQQQTQSKREQRPGLALAFHSSVFRTVRRGQQPGIPPHQGRPCADKLHAAAKNDGDSPAAGLASASVVASTVVVPVDQPTATTEKATRKEAATDVAVAKDDRKHSLYHPKGVRHGSFEPGRFGYSLGKPFHSQRVTSVKLVIAGAPISRLESGQGGFPTDLHLITGE